MKAVTQPIAAARSHPHVALIHIGKSGLSSFPLDASNRLQDTFPTSYGNADYRDDRYRGKSYRPKCIV